MTSSIVKQTLREIEPLRTDDAIGEATRTMIASGLPALPATESDGSFAGIFGEREFMVALFPAYVGTLASTSMIRRSLDVTIERRQECLREPIRDYLTREKALVGDDYSDTQIAELFINQRVLVIPVATDGRVHAVVTRSDFFAALVSRMDA